MKIQLKRSNVLDGSVAKAPEADQMEFGEIAINYAAGDPSIFIKDSDEAIIKLIGEGAFSEHWSLSGNTLVPTDITNDVAIGASQQISLETSGTATFGATTFAGVGNGGATINYTGYLGLYRNNDGATGGASNTNFITGYSSPNDSTAKTAKFWVEPNGDATFRKITGSTPTLVTDGDAILTTKGYVDTEIASAVSAEDYWQEASNMLYPQDTSDGIAIGVNSPDNPSISLNNDGSIDAVGTITANLFSGPLPYSDLTGTPTIPTNNNQLTNGAGYYKSGDSPTFGQVTIPETPTANTSATSKKYVDDSISASGGGTVTSITADAPLTGGTITASGSIGISQASGSTAGSMSSADFNKLSDIPSDATSNTGTVTSVATGTGLSGGTITTSGTISVDDQEVMMLSGTQTIGGAKTFSDNAIFNGDITASSGTITADAFVGSGSGLTDLPNAFKFKGRINQTGTAPTPTDGDYYMCEAAGTAAASWIGIAGTLMNENQLMVYSSTADDGSGGTGRWFTGASGSSVAPGTYLPLSGGTLSGPGDLTVSGTFNATTITGPIAAAGTLGVVKIGSGINISDGVISVPSAPDATQVNVTAPITNSGSPTAPNIGISVASATATGAVKITSALAADASPAITAATIGSVNTVSIAASNAQNDATAAGTAATNAQNAANAAQGTADSASSAAAAAQSTANSASSAASAAQSTADAKTNTKVNSLTGDVTLAGSGATSVSVAGNTITIDSTDNNTVYGGSDSINVGTSNNISLINSYVKANVTAYCSTYTGTTVKNDSQLENLVCFMPPNNGTDAPGGGIRPVWVANGLKFCPNMPSNEGDIPAGQARARIANITLEKLVQVGDPTVSKTGTRIWGTDKKGEPSIWVRKSASDKGLLIQATQNNADVFTVGCDGVVTAKSNFMTGGDPSLKQRGIQLNNSGDADTALMRVGRSVSSGKAFQIWGDGSVYIEMSCNGASIFNGGMVVNANLTADKFIGNITGNVTGNCTGSAGSCAYSNLTGTTPIWNQNTTGNAATADNASTLGGENKAYYRNASYINDGKLGKSYLSGSYDINISGSAGSCAYSNLTGSTPIWNQNTTGNAATSSTCNGNAASSSSCSGNAATATKIYMNNNTDGNNLRVGIVNRSTGNGPVAYNDFFKTDCTNGKLTCVTLNETSDYRIKKDITPLSSAISMVNALNPVTYKWNSGVTVNDEVYTTSDAETNTGFIAHEVQAVIPSAIVGEKDGDEIQSLTTTPIIAVLTKALQEALAKIETLETKVAALESA